MSFFPTWVSDISIVMTILGFFITLAVFYQTQFIKSRFINKARLPEILQELRTATSRISSYLGNWKESEKALSAELHTCKGLIESLKPRLNDVNRKQAVKLISLIDNRPWHYYISRSPSKKIDEDKAWILYGELSRLNTLLDQTVKDQRFQ